MNISLMKNGDQRASHERNLRAYLGYDQGAQDEAMEISE
jgi:hypothetical protein